MTFRWNKNKEKQLISRVHDNESLWNKWSEDHKKSKVLSAIWSSIANELNITRDQARNKWKTLQTQYFKEVAKSTSNSKSTWFHFESMSFLSDNVCQDSPGNLDLLDEADESDETQVNQEVNCNSSQQFDKLSNCSHKDNFVERTETSMAINSPSEANWNFLISSLPNMEAIAGNNLKFQFRVEAYVLLFNFATDNKLSKENNQELELFVKKEYENFTKKDRSSRQINEEMEQPANKEGKNNESPILNDQSLNHRSNEVVTPAVINDSTSSEKNIKVEPFVDDEIFLVHEGKCAVDVKPSTAMKKWLKNPFVLKKEEP